MSRNCLNLKNPVIRQNLSELGSLIGPINAEHLLIQNNGYSIEYMPDGTNDPKFQEAMTRLDGNRALALKERAKELLYMSHEMQEIKEKAIKDGTFMKAPNGKSTNLNERQWLQVRTKAFKRWFGDWESIAARVANARVIWGHPGIGKTEYYKKNNKNVIDFDSVYKPRINKELGLPEGAEERKKWRREHRDEYTQKILDLFDEAVEDAKKQGKQLLVSDMVVLQERESALDLITQMSEDTFAKRSEQRNEPYDDNKKLWKTDIDESIAKLSDKYKIVNTEKYLSELYEDSKNVSKVVDENGEPLVMYHEGTSDIRVFKGDSYNLSYFGDSATAATYGGSEYSVFLNIKNPQIIEGKGEEIGYITEKKYGTRRISPANGYDGVMYKNVKDVGEGIYSWDVDEIGNFWNNYEKQGFGTVYAVSNPNKIKSATDNVGTFSNENDDIRYNQEVSDLFDLLDYISIKEKFIMPIGEDLTKNYELLSKYHRKYYLPRTYGSDEQIEDTLRTYLIAHDLPIDIVDFERTKSGRLVAYLNEEALQDVIERNNENAEVGNLFDTPEETKMVTTVLNKLSAITGLRYKTVTEQEAQEITGKKDMSLTNAFVYNDTCYFIQGRRLNTDIAAEEMLHPFVAAIKKHNPKAFGSLLTDARKAFPRLRLELAEQYKSNRNIRNEELVTQALSRAFREDIKNTPEGNKLRDLIKSFINYVMDVFRNFVNINGELKHHFTNIDNILQNKEVKAEDLASNITIAELAKVINSDIEKLESSLDVFRQNESDEKQIEYTPKGKARQTYTIRGNHIFNKNGKEVFKENSKDRNKIFANLAVQEGRAVVVTYKDKDYVVNRRDQIISVTTGDMMQWGYENGDRKAVLDLAKTKFDGLIKKNTNINLPENIKNTYDTLVNDLGGGNVAKEEVKDTVKVAKKGMSFEEVLAGQESFFTSEEQEQIKQGLNGKNLQVMSVSRLTDPAFFSKEIISFLERNAKKALNDSTRVSAIEIWSKHDGLPIKDILDACKKYRVAPMVSFSITGLGGTALEGGVMKYQDMLQKIGELINNGTLNPVTTTIRIDPILVGVTNMEDIKTIVTTAKSFGIKKFVTSLVQSYGYTDGTAHDRKVISGINNALATENKTYDWDKYYGRNANGKINFKPKQQYIDEVGKILLELDSDPEITIQTCAFGIKGLKVSACLDPMIIERIVGVDITRPDGSYQRDTSRPECMCYGCHGDFFKGQNKKCYSSCAYCYAAHSGDNKLNYYNEDGTLKDNEYTRTSRINSTDTLNLPEVVAKDSEEIRTKVIGEMLQNVSWMTKKFGNYTGLELADKLSNHTLSVNEVIGILLSDENVAAKFSKNYKGVKNYMETYGLLEDTPTETSGKIKEVEEAVKKRNVEETAAEVLDPFFTKGTTETKQEESIKPVALLHRSEPEVSSEVDRKLWKRNVGRFRDKDAKLQSQAESVYALHHFPNLTAKKRQDIAYEFTQQIINLVESVLDNDEYFGYYLEDFPVIFNEDVQAKLDEVRKESDYSSKYRKVFKVIGTKNIFDIVLADIEDTLYRVEPLFATLWKAEGDKRTFRIAYLNDINQYLFDYFGFTINESLKLNRKAKEALNQDTTTEQLDSDEIDELLAETGRDFDFLTSNLNRKFTENLDLKIKNLFGRIPIAGKYNEYDSPKFYPKQFVINTIAQICGSCLSYEEMLDKIKNYDDSKIPFKKEVLEIMRVPKYRQLFNRSLYKSNQEYFLIRNNASRPLTRRKPKEYFDSESLSSQLIESAVFVNSPEAKTALLVYTNPDDVQNSIHINKEVKNKIQGTIREFVNSPDSKISFGLKGKIVGKVIEKPEIEFTVNLWTSKLKELFDLFGLWRLDDEHIQYLITKGNDIDNMESLNTNDAAELLHSLYVYVLSDNVIKNPLSKKALERFSKLDQIFSDAQSTIREPIVYDNDKGYATVTNTNFIKQLEKKIKRAHRLDSYEKFVQDEFNKYSFFGKYYNRGWFKSWIKDGLNDFNFQVLTTFNGRAYDEMIYEYQHLEFALINFIRCTGDLAYYVLPVLSDKTTNGTIAGKIFDKEEVIDRLFSVMMQELDRIKQVYNRANLRRTQPSIARVKNFDTGPLEIDNETGLAKIKFDHKVGGAEFKLMSLLNDELHLINDKIDSNEHPLAYIFQQLIYNESQTQIYDLLSSDGSLFSSLRHSFKEYCSKKLDSIANEFSERLLSGDLKQFFDLHFPNILQEYNVSHKQNAVIDIKELLNLFFINNFYAKTQILELLVGDMALYDGWNDAQKRMAAIVSPTLKYDLNAAPLLPDGNPSKDKYSEDGIKRALVISDVVGESNQFNTITKIFDKRREMAINRFKKVRGITGDIKIETYPELLDIIHGIDTEQAAFRKTNGTDGQGFLSFTGLAKHLGMLGYAPEYLNDLITDLRSVLYNTSRDVQRSKWDEIKRKYPSALFEIQKQFTYGPTTYVDNVNDNLVKLGTMVKNAEMPLVDFDEMLSGNRRNPLLLELLKFMDKNNIDVIYTDSNVKSGVRKIVDLNDCKTTKEVRAKLDKAISNENKSDYILEIPYEYVGEQQPVNKHYLDSDFTFGTQVMKLMPSIIARSFSSKFVDFKGKQYTVGQFIREYENVVSRLYKNQFKQLKDYLNIDKKTFNKLQLGTPLTEDEALNVRIGLCKYMQEEMAKDPQISVQEMDGFMLNPDGTWQFPMNDGPTFTKLSKLYSKLIKKLCVKLKVKGGMFVQATDAMRLNIINDNNTIDTVGSDNLKIIYKDADGTETATPTNPVGIAYLEARLPYYYQKMYSTYPNQKDIPEELRKMICYRTPTEGACSIFPIKVVGFSPKMAGGKIQLPMDITTIAGVDFDIDKLFFHAPNIDKDGHYIDYTPDVKYLNSNQLQNMLIDMMWETCTSENYMYEMFTISNFEILKKYANIFMIFDSYSVDEQTTENFNTLKNTDNESLDAMAKKLNMDRQLCDFSVEMYIHQRNALSAGEIGPLAINNIIHSLLEGRNITLNNVFTNRLFCNVHLGAKTVIDPIYDVNGNLISVNNRIFQAAAVDGAKSPVLGVLGLNMNSINLLLPLIRMGVSLEDCILFIKQPIVKKVLSDFQMELDAYEFKSAKDKTLIKPKLNSDYINKYIENAKSNQTNTAIITKASLITGLSDSYDSEKQEPLLGMLKELLSASDMLRSITPALRSDTSTGTSDLQTIFDFVAHFINLKKIMEKPQSNKAPQFSTNFYELFDLHSNGRIDNIATQINLMDQLVNTLMNVSDPIFSKFITFVVSDVLESTNKKLSGMDISRMYNEWLVFQMMDSFLDGSDETLKYYAFSIDPDVKLLQKRLRGKEEFKNNLIVKFLYHNPYKDMLGINITGMSNEVVSKVSYDWITLLESSDQDAYQLGWILLTYVFYRNGGMNEANSMSRFINNDIKQLIGGYREFLTNLSSKDRVSITKELDTFKYLYFRHHPENATDLKENYKEVIEIDKPFKDVNGDTLTDDAGHELYPVITVVPKYKKQEMYPFGVYNGHLYQAMSGSADYLLVEKLGGKVLEYTNPAKSSVISSNRIGFYDKDNDENWSVFDQYSPTIDFSNDVSDADPDSNNVAEESVFNIPISDKTANEADKNIEDSEACFSVE